MNFNYTPRPENLNEIIRLKRETKANLELEIQQVREMLESFRQEHKALSDDFIYKTNRIDDITNTLKEVETRLEIEQRTLQTLSDEIKGKQDQLATLEDLTDQIEVNQRVLNNLLIQIEENTEISKELDSQVKQKGDKKITLELENERLSLDNQKKKESINKIELLLIDNTGVLNSIKEITQKNEEILDEIKKKKKEFISNPLSIGYYARIIKNKTGIDIIKVIT